jgi:hypothetical protein
MHREEEEEEEEEKDDVTLAGQRQLESSLLFGYSLSSLLKVSCINLMASGR